jgi:hypothetical protein
MPLQFVSVSSQAITVLNPGLNANGIWMSHFNFFDYICKNDNLSVI